MTAERLMTIQNRVANFRVYMPFIPFMSMPFIPFISLG